MPPAHRMFALLLSGTWAATCLGQAPLPNEASAIAPQQAVAATISRLIQGAIPLEFEKKKDWGATTELPAGWHIQGKPFHWHVQQRGRSVNHGVWKHYRLRLVDPEKNLHVQLEPLRPAGLGRVAFTLHIDAKIDAWARAKVYQYGVHIMALEAEGDMQVHLTLQGELGLEMTHPAEGTLLSVAPAIASSRIDLGEFNLRRVSNADGPIIHELGKGLRQLAEDELNGPRLTDKLNRAIEKNRDRLAFRPSELFKTDWWPLEGWSASPTPTPAASAADRAGAGS